MTSRERLRKAIHHQQPDRPPLDLGSTLVTGIQAGAYARLKKALGIDTGTVRVYDPYQMLAEVEEPVKKALGVDTVGIQLPTTMFGYRNENWKPFRMFDGTEVEMSGHFEYDVLPNGDIVQYPKGDRIGPPSGPHAEGRLLLRHDRPPGAHRRVEAGSRGNGWRRPTPCTPRRSCASSRRPPVSGTRTPTTACWATSGARDSATSPSCPGPRCSTRRASAIPRSGTCPP